VNPLPVPGAVLRLAGVGPPGGRPLLVLHGGPGEAYDCLRPYLDRLASSGRRVVYYDQRGSGGSALAEGATPAGWEVHCADVEAVHRHLGGEPIDLLGFSWGALLALLYASERPAPTALAARRGRVSRLVLVSPPPTRAGHDEDIQGNLRRAAARPEVAALLAELAPIADDTSDPEASRRARFACRVAPYFADPRRALNLAPVEIREDAAAAIARSLRGVEPRLDALRSVPALVLRGEVDPVPAAAAAETAEALGARLVVLEGAGHAPFAEAEDAFVAAITAFLDGAPCP
jgi:pimeloyl-ACP methyl ester carboxylesterase